MEDLLSKVFETTPYPPLWALGVALLLTGLTLFYPKLWKIMRHFVTLAHESGHAVVGVLTGRKLSGIKLHTDTSGVTATLGTKWGVSGMLTTAAGYPAPATVGGMIIAGLIFQKSNLAIAILAVILAILLLFVRNIWGAVIAGVTLTVLAVTLWGAPLWLSQMLAVYLTGLFIAGSLRTLIEERHTRRMGNEGSDIWLLASQTPFPAGLWWATLFAVSVGWAIAPFVVWYLTR